MVSFDDASFGANVLILRARAAPRTWCRFHTAFGRLMYETRRPTVRDRDRADGTRARDDRARDMDASADAWSDRAALLAELRDARAEIARLRARAEAREIEFRDELRALAAQCASLSASVAVAGSASANLGLGVASGQGERASGGAGGGGAAREAFAGDLSSFFFKTAKHARPVWESTSERRHGRGDVGASDEAVEEEGRGGAGGRGGGFDWKERGDAFEDDGEADLADSLRDDEGLVDALLRGGVEGERAAEILAERLRVVGFESRPLDDADAFAAPSP